MDEDGKSWWSIAAFVNLVHGKPVDFTYGRAVMYQGCKGKSSEHGFNYFDGRCQWMRIPGTRGPKTAVMDARGLMALLERMRLRRADQDMVREAVLALRELRKRDEAGPTAGAVPAP